MMMKIEEENKLKLSLVSLSCIIAPASRQAEMPRALFVLDVLIAAGNTLCSAETP